MRIQDTIRIDSEDHHLLSLACKAFELLGGSDLPDTNLDKQIKNRLRNNTAFLSDILVVPGILTNMAIQADITAETAPCPAWCHAPFAHSFSEDAWRTERRKAAVLARQIRDTFVREIESRFSQVSHPALKFKV